MYVKFIFVLIGDKLINKFYSAESETDPLEPPEGFICGCGATTPGKTATAKWRLDGNGVFKCISCYGKKVSFCDFFF